MSGTRAVNPEKLFALWQSDGFPRSQCSESQRSGLSPAPEPGADG